LSYWKQDNERVGDKVDLGIKNKVAVVTGVGRGIGKATALTLAAEGVNISLNDIDEAAGLATAKEIESLGVDTLFIKGDVSKEEDVKQLFKATNDKFGQIDILINNAGISPKLPFYEITPEAFDGVIDVNLRSNFMCSKEAFEYMKNNGWGRIVSLSSLAGLHGAINSAAHYSASKAAIIGLTKTLSKQMGPYDITVNCVAPGRIDTAMTRMLTQEQLDQAIQKTSLRRLGTVEEVARVITFLASDGGSYITGACVEILGGYTG